jgi:hypothetical protein
MPELPDWLIAAGAIASALLALAGVWRLTSPARARARSLAQRANRALDVVLGTPEIPDPDRPGEVLRPAIPDIGVRMTRQETLLEQVVLGAVEEARQSAKAAAASADTAARSAAAAAASAQAAESIVASDHSRIGELALRVENLTGAIAAHPPEA